MLATRPPAVWSPSGARQAIPPVGVPAGASPPSLSPARSQDPPDPLVRGETGSVGLPAGKDRFDDPDGAGAARDSI